MDVQIELLYKKSAKSLYSKERAEMGAYLGNCWSGKKR
jgi:hypothetical protein